MNRMFAGVTTEDLINQAVREHTRSWSSEIWVILLALLGVTGLMFVCVKIFWKPKRRGSGTLFTGQTQPKRRRRRRQEHRQRNPTLSETGGLPPKRSADPPPSAT